MLAIEASMTAQRTLYLALNCTRDIPSEYIVSGFYGGGSETNESRDQSNSHTGQDATESTIFYTVKQDSWYSRNLKATEPSGALLATMSSPLTALGKWQISFIQGGASHNITMEPVRVGSSADRFVAEGVLYFWDVFNRNDRKKVFSLYRVANDGTMTEVGRLVKRGSRCRGEALWLLVEQVDQLVGVMTAIGVLKRFESFR